MNISRRPLLAGFGLTGLGVAVLNTPARAASAVVQVKLWDTGIHAMDKFGHELMRGLGTPGATLPNPTMGITATPSTIKAGEITFEATNASKDTIHEMIVAPLADPSKPLPYKTDEQRVEEEKAEHLGEVSELAPGKTGALRITLQPGKYLLYCNVPGHYALGMWTEITVTA